MARLGGAGNVADVVAQLRDDGDDGGPLNRTGALDGDPSDLRQRDHHVNKPLRASAWLRLLGSCGCLVEG